MATPTTARRAQTPAQLELEGLEALPCGCVAAAYRAVPWEISVVSVEAKGPHCVLPEHALGQILGLGDTGGERP